MPANLTREQVRLFASAHELEIELPTNITKRQLWQRYHLDFSPSDENDENGGWDFFWGEDLRSCCGIMGDDYDMHDLILFPEHYIKFFPREFLKLLRDAESITVRVPGNRLASIEWPKLGLR